MKYLFYTLGLLGILNTWGRLSMDGTMLHLFHALHGANDHILPGTTSLLERNITGIYWPIDYLLDILIVFFWEAVDGSHPATSAIGVYFLGQMFSILVAFYTDYHRRVLASDSNLVRCRPPFPINLEISGTIVTTTVLTLVWDITDPRSGFFLSNSSLWAAQASSGLSPIQPLLLPQMPPSHSTP